MKFKMISDHAARVQIRADLLSKIVRQNDSRFSGSPTVTHNGCWIHKDPGGWVTIAAFGSDAQAEMDLLKDLEALDRLEQEGGEHHY